jgi:hypothetical protein
MLGTIYLPCVVAINQIECTQTTADIHFCCSTAMICLVDKSLLVTASACTASLPTPPIMRSLDAHLYRLARYLPTHDLTVCLVLVVPSERQGDFIGEKHTQGHGPGSPLGPGWEMVIN